MSMFKFAVLVSGSNGEFSCLPAVCGAQSPNLGARSRPKRFGKVEHHRIARWKGFRRAAGRFRQGAAVYANNCQVCHGLKGAGKPQDQLTGGLGTLASGKPVKTPASYWPVATTLFDYIRRAMPITSPESLTNDEVYAVTAYILSIDGIVPGKRRARCQVPAAGENAEPGWVYKLVAEAAPVKNVFFPGAGRPHRRAALEGKSRRRNYRRPLDLPGRWRAVHQHRAGEQPVHVRAARMTIAFCGPAKVLWPLSRSLNNRVLRYDVCISLFFAGRA